MISRANKWLLSLGVILAVSGIVFPILTNWILANRGARLGLFIPVAKDLGFFLICLGSLVAASALFYYQKGVRKTYRIFVVPLTIALSSSVVALVAVEIVLHFTYRDVQVGGVNSPSGVTFYRKFYKYNSWGFRDIERQTAKAHGTFRILVLGDSFTFGAGVKFKEQLYTALLEDKLNKSGLAAAKVEVINTGRKGLSTEQELRYLLDTGLSLDPDLVIVGHVLNDAETPELKREIEQDFRSTAFLPERYHRILNAYSFTYYLARMNLIGLRQRAVPADDTLIGYHAYLNNLYQGDNLVGYYRIVADLARTCHEHGAGLLWVSFPSILSARQVPYPFSHVTDILRSLAVQNHFEFLDLQPALQASSAKQLTVSAWDSHPNEIVHEIAAQEIYSRLISDKLIQIAPAAR